jgi:nucleoid DNA-binding protein
MQPIATYLKRLMLDYDCVTIPGLGGFIMQKQHARISQGKNRIYPPSRAISFNSLLSHDDGLLISAIARSRQLGYNEAAIVVSEYVNDCKRQLQAGDTLILEGIGEITPGPEKGLVFRSQIKGNFCSDLYGMDSISLYPITRPQPVARLEKKPADRKPVPVSDRKPASVKWTLMLATPVIIFLLYGIIFPQSIQNIYTQYSGFFYSNPQPVTLHQPVISHEPAPVVAAPEIKEVKEEPVVETKIMQAASGPKFYIIGGCFESEENAGKFMAGLVKRGFEAERAGTTNHGHVRISYKSFNEKPEALSYLQKIRAEENSSAWLLKY